MRLSILSVILAAAGCHYYEKPKFDVGDRSMVLIPFRDLSVRYGHGYGESLRGRNVVASIRNWAETHWNPNFVEGKEVTRAIKTLREWTETKITPTDWRRILGMTEAELAMIGEIKSIRLQDPKMIGARRGKIVGRYFVIHVQSGKTVYRSTDIDVLFPKPTEFGQPLTDFETDSDYIEKGLIRDLGVRIGKDLFGYYHTDRYNI